MGIIWDNFKMFGKDPSDMQMLYNFVNIGAITRAAILINFIGISFVAVLFELF